MMEEAKSAADSGWWRRNRWALMALLPLGALAVVASSYQYVTLYKPSEFTRVVKGTGPTLKYSENFMSNHKSYRREVALSVKSATSRPLPPKEIGGKGATLWEVELQFAAKPDVPLQNCSLALVDSEGRVYATLQLDYTSDIIDRPMNCAPTDTPGPQFDFVGDLKPAEGGVRPAKWPLTARFAMPPGRKPAYVRIFWDKPNAALVPIP